MLLIYDTGGLSPFPVCPKPKIIIKVARGVGLIHSDERVSAELNSGSPRASFPFFGHLSEAVAVTARGP